MLLWVVGRLPAIERAGIDVTIAALQAVFRLAGRSIERQGTFLLLPGANINIVSECSPHLPILVYAAVVLAFPASWGWRLAGILCGALLIHVFNVARILSLIWILLWRPPWFEFAHVYLWQTGTILVVFAAFLIWLRLLPGQPRPA